MRKIVLTAAALRDLDALPAGDRKAMIALINAYARGVAVDAMRNRSGDVVRLKAGDYRAVVSRERATITVRRVRHRSIVYRPR